MDAVSDGEAKAERIDAESGLLASREGKTLAWRGLNYSVRGRKGEDIAILKNQFGTIPAGHCAALMGPSGAGKTSLLNVLAGRIVPSEVKKIAGDVRLNDEVIDPVANREQVAYVMQDDALLPTQTPREALHFSAALRRRELGKERREALVNEMLRVLDIEDCADTMIGGELFTGISGGQKKRVSVGVDLLTNPAMVFLDEPTSGLDSYNAEQVVKLLKKVAVSGATVACTIHQPSSEIFALFDTVVLLKSGRVSFCGTIPQMVAFFAERGFECPAAWNPADFTMDIIEERAEEDLDKLDLFLAPPEASEVVDFTDQEPAGKTRASHGFADAMLEFQWLADRELKHSLRDTDALGARFGATIFLNLVFALVLQGVGDNDDTDPDNLAAHFGGIILISAMVMFGSGQSLAAELPAQRPTFLREYVSGTYSASNYFLGRLPAELSIGLVQSLIVLFLVFWLMELRGNFGLYLLAFWGLGFAAASTTLVVACGVSDVRQTVEFISPIFVPQLLFIGFFVRVEDIPIFLRWAQWLCSLKYAAALLVLIEFDEECTEAEAQTCADLRSDNDVDRDLWWLYIVLLIVLILVLRTAAMFVLVNKSKTVY